MRKLEEPMGWMARSGVGGLGPSTIFPEGWKISGTVYKSEDGHGFWGDPVDQPVALDGDLPDIRGARFRDDAPSLGQGSQRSGGCACVSDQGGCVVSGIAGDELGGLLQVEGRRF